MTPGDRRGPQDAGAAGGAAGGALPCRAEHEAQPPSPLRLPRAGGQDSATTGDEKRVRRLIHLDGRPAVLTAVLCASGRVELAAEATTAADAELALRRARFWTGVDDDLTPFLERFAGDPRIGASVREAPWLRPYRRPMPFEVLAAAICEQLITDERALAIKRSILRAHGPRRGELRDFPGPAGLAALAPAELERCGLAATRARTLRRIAAEVASGRIELLDPARQDEGWRRLRAIPGVGSWTLNTLALHGQGRHDALPAGDNAYRVLVGEVLRGPGAKADEREVLDFFAPYAGWRGVAGWHLLRSRRRGDPRAGRRPGVSAAGPGPGGPRDRRG